MPLSLHLTLPPFLPVTHFLCLAVHPNTSRGVPGTPVALDSATPTSHHEGTYNRRTEWVKASSLLAPSDPPGVTSRRHVLTEVMGGLGWDYCLVFWGDSLGCRLSGHCPTVRPLASHSRCFIASRSLRTCLDRPQVDILHLSAQKRQTLTSGSANVLALPQMVPWKLEICIHIYTYLWCDPYTKHSDISYSLLCWGRVINALYSFWINKANVFPESCL